MTRIFGITIGVRGMGRGGGGGGFSPIFKKQFSAQKTSNIRAKPLDFRASNGENIRARNLSRTPMGITSLGSFAMVAIKWSHNLNGHASLMRLPAVSLRLLDDRVIIKHNHIDIIL